MSDPVEVITFAHGRVEIHYAWYDVESPDRWGNEDVFLGEIDTRHFRIGRERWTKHTAYPYLPYGDWPWDYENVDFYDLPDNSVESEEELRRVWEEEKETDYVAFPVELCPQRYGHARLYEVQSGSGEEPDGFVFVKTPWGENATPLQQLASVKDQPFDPYTLFRRVLAQWNEYLSGEVYECYLFIYAEGPDPVDSIADVYGLGRAQEIAREMISSELQAETKE